MADLRHTVRYQGSCIFNPRINKPQRSATAASYYVQGSIHDEILSENDYKNNQAGGGSETSMTRIVSNVAKGKKMEEEDTPPGSGIVQTTRLRVAQPITARSPGFTLQVPVSRWSMVKPGDASQSASHYVLHH